MTRQDCDGESIENVHGGEWDARLAERVAFHPMMRRRNIQVSGRSGRVLITGKVANFYEKQLIQEFIRHFDGVREIDNQVEVAYT